MVFTTLYQKMCCLINTCEYIFCKCIEMRFSYHQVILLIHRNICQNESYSVTVNFAAPMSENIYLMPCGFLKLLYLNVKDFQSKLDIYKIFFCLKNAEDNSIIFSVRIINTSYLKAYFKTTTTMVSTNFKMNFIFDESIIDEQIASKKNGKLSKLKVIH